jgi:hypothetical protein
MFTYESCCPIETPTGKMRGSFRSAITHDMHALSFNAAIQPMLTRLGCRVLACLTRSFKDDYTDQEFDALIQPFTFDTTRNYC